MRTTDWSIPDIVEHVRSTRLFAGFDDDALERFAEAATICLAAAGDHVMVEGDAADAAYIVIAGRLSVMVGQVDGTVRRINDVGPGEVIGEMGLLTGDPRSATVTARRDSALIRIGADDFRSVVVEHPEALLALTRTVVKRLNQSIHEDRPDMLHSVIAVMPAGTRPAHHDFARDLSDALPGAATIVTHLDAERALGEEAGLAATAQYLHRIEDDHTYVLLVGDGDDAQWLDLCRRQCDVAIYVGHADGMGDFADYEPEINERSSTDHVVIVQTGDLPSGTRSILERRGTPRHHHIRKGSHADVSRIARIVSGTSVGVVFGGGGARGFAHIGVLRAMIEAGLPIDHVGGTSIGASVASVHAMGEPWERIFEMERWVTSGRGRIVDATLPSVALAKGRRLVTGMRSAYGDTEIEDLWIDFLCISTDLSVGDIYVHRSGPVWAAVRASTAVPGVFAPMRSVEGHVLVDGGVLDNLPINPMADAFAPATIVAVDLRAPANLAANDLPNDGIVSGWRVGGRAMLPWVRPMAVPGVVESMIAASLVSQDAGGRAADAVLQPPVARFGFMDFEAGDAIVDIGYQYAVDYFEANGLP